MRGISAALGSVVALALAGCGGGGGGGDAAIELTKRLPPDAIAYRALDLAALKSEHGLDEEADPMKLSPWVNVGDAFALLLVDGEGSASAPVGEEPPDPKPPRALRAFELGAVTAVATSQREDEHDGNDIAVLATTQDTGELGSALGDLGYEDRDGVLEDPAGGPAVRLEEGIVYVAATANDLRALPDEPADDLPMELLSEVEGDEVLATDPKIGCIRELAYAGAVDRGQIAYLIDGEADADRFQTSGDDAVEDIDVDGSRMVVVVDLSGVSSGIMGFVADSFAGYDCG